MQVLFTRRAQKALEAIIDYVERRNTSGSGNRFALKFEEILTQYALENVTYAKCNHVSLKQLNYSCITISRWVVAFKVKDQKFIIYRIVWGAILR
jgi:hypothetical protein